MSTAKAPAARLKSGYVEVDGMEIHHTFGGRRQPPLVLVHGLGSAGYIEWRFNLAPLASRRRVLAPDLPGFGRSGRAGRYGIVDFARTLEGYLDGLGLSSVDLAGASLGGRVALELALRNPGLVRKLVLVNSLGLGRPALNPFYPLVTLPRVGEALLGLLGLGWRRASPDLLRRVFTRYVGTQAEIERLVDDKYIEQMRALHDEESYPEAYLATVRSLASPRTLLTRGDLVGRLAATGLPVLLIWGMEDRLFPYAHAVRAHAALPGSRLALIEGAGHTPQAERPEEFNRLVAGFLG